MKQTKAVFVVSLDFELYWGWRDVCDLESLKPSLMNVRPTVLRLLELFQKHEIHATWATVGFLFFANRNQLLRGLPSVTPNYLDDTLSPYSEIIGLGHDEKDDPFHYAPSLIEAILETPHQELGTHTFSHYYCLEDGQTLASFKSDLDAAIGIAKHWEVELRSLVFPRNQVNPDYLQACADAGIQAYRGAGHHWMYRERKRCRESLVRRACRLLDAYVNLSGHNTFEIKRTLCASPFNIPASRFLRPYSARLRSFEGVRLHRICRGLDFAVNHGHAYHLWFHPEDLAMDLENNLAFLARVLRHFEALRDRGAIESLNMRELATRLAGSPSAFSNDNCSARV